MTIAGLERRAQYGLALLAVGDPPDTQTELRNFFSVVQAYLRVKHRKENERRKGTGSLFSFICPGLFVPVLF
jgi:hypothetical protein